MLAASKKRGKMANSPAVGAGGRGAHGGAPTGRGSERHGVAGVEEVALVGMLQGDVVFGLELLDAQAIAGPDVLA